MLHKYFARSPKQHIEFSNVVEIMETKGLKIFRIVNTHWLKMVSPLKRTMSEHMTLIYKMAEDAKDTTNPDGAWEVAKANISLLVDIFVPIALVVFSALA